MRSTRRYGASAYSSRVTVLIVVLALVVLAVFLLYTDAILSALPDPLATVLHAL